MQTKQRLNFYSSAINLANLAEFDKNIDEILNEIGGLPEKLCRGKCSALAVLLKVRIELLSLLVKDEDRRVREEVAHCLNKFVKEFLR